MINCDYIQAARRRVEEMRTSNPPLEPPTVSELEEALGEQVGKCELWAENWRNRVYRVEFACGRTAMAKQLVRGTQAMLQYQHDQLGVLGKLRIPGLRVPKPLALLRAKRVVVMEFARGKPILALLWNRTSGSDLLPACELAGNILARIQMSRTEKICPLPVESLARDFAAAPWHLSFREGKILQSALAHLAAAEVAMGEVYYDYKPANLLCENNELFLVDPPDLPRHGVHLWDFSIFRSSMRRHLWRLNLRRPFSRQRAIVRQGLAAFERTYLASFSKRHPEPPLFAPAARLFELQRTAVLMTMQKGKVEMARQKMPIAREGRLGNSLANRTTLPLLEMEKRWLFLQLARELP